MASKQMHLDQENLPPRSARVHHSKRIVSNPNQQERTKLGLLDHNKLENKGNVAVTKQPFGQTKSTNVPVKSKKKVVDDSSEMTSTEFVQFALREIVMGIKEPKEKREQIEMYNSMFKPMIEGFEACKVQEDEDKPAKIDDSVPKRNRLYARSEVAELKRKEDIPSSVKHENDPTDPATYQHTSDLFIMEEYSADIYEYLKERELRNRPKPTYIRKQPDVTANMRAILVDWLVEVSEEYKLQTETLYLAVNYIDRFLSYMSVVRTKLQLVGTSAMFTASKYEEIYPPELDEFVYITDNTYSTYQVIRMEYLIVKVLNYDLSVATPLSFITAICTTNKFDDKIKFLAMYLCELSLLEGENYLIFLPSTLAAGAIVVANKILDLPIWSEEFGKSTGYTLDQLMPCIQFLCKIFQNAPTNPQHAIQDKYRSQKYLHVSQLSTERDMDFRCQSEEKTPVNTEESEEQL